MAEFPDIPVGYGVPLVDLATDLLPEPTMDAISALVDASIAAAPGAPTVAQNTAILFGTSLEEQGGPGADTLDPGLDGAIHGRGWFHWMNGYLGNAFKLVRNAGIGGNTYAQMLARIGTDVLAYDSDWVMMGGPTNDTSTGRTAAAIIADATAMLDLLEADGRRVLILTGPPNGGHTTTPEYASLFDVNEWIRALPLTRKNVIVADAWNVLAPATGVSPATAMAIDAVHFSVMGAERVGRAAAAALSPVLTRTPRGVANSLDPAVFLANPNFDSSGSGWAALGTGVSAAYSLEAGTSRNKATITFAGVTSTGHLGIQATELLSAGRFAIGDVVQITARIRWSNVVSQTVATTNVRPILQLTARHPDLTTVLLERAPLFVALAQYVNVAGFPASGDMVVTTAKFTVPANTFQLEVRVGFQGITSGTVEVTDLYPVKIT